MGFFDTLGDLGKKAFDKTAEFGREAQEKRDEFRDDYRYSDERLMQMSKSGPMSTKMAAGAVLKERGYRLVNREWIR